MDTVRRTWYYVCMPKVTIWIRKEDEASWNAITDKPEWLHNRLVKAVNKTLTSMEQLNERKSLKAQGYSGSGKHGMPLDD